MSDPIRVIIVDDQQLVRAGFAMVIASQPDLQVVAQAGDGREAVQAVREHPADVVLMDVRMPELDGIGATREIMTLGAQGHPIPRVIILTTFDLDEYVLAAIRHGASGFLLKDTPPEEMLTAIRTVHRGDAVIAPSSTRRLLTHLLTLPHSDSAPDAAATPVQDTEDNSLTRHRLAALTEREVEVLKLVAQGLSNQEIASELFLAEPTVKTHVGRLLAKLEARDRVQLVIFAYEAEKLGWSST